MKDDVGRQQFGDRICVAPFPSGAEGCDRR
jgi:hypothetical protein